MAGNPGVSEYSWVHVQVLRQLLDSHNPHYIIGTCANFASLEKELALEYQAILMAQVGPPSFYADRNPFVFGIHVNSDIYSQWVIKQLAIFTAEPPRHGSIDDVTFDNLPVHVIYRNQSEFHRSACSSAATLAKELGFKDVVTFAFDPLGDDDGNGILNEADENFLNLFADQVCSPDADDQGTYRASPALMSCLETEYETMIARWQHNQCRPTIISMTTTSRSWGTQTPLELGYFASGAQWFEGLPYSDRYFDSGEALQEEAESEFGYPGNGDTVASYAIPVLFGEHLASIYRTVDNPDIANLVSGSMERVRRDLRSFRVDSLFGPLAFDQNQRNIGREAIGTQWLPTKDLLKQGIISNSEAKEAEFKNVQVSPTAQTLIEPTMHVEVAESCRKGNFVSLARVAANPCYLCETCEVCPEDTFTTNRNFANSCTPCPEGTSTEGRVGSLTCTRQEPNLIPLGIKYAGYSFVGINWLLALVFMSWTFRNRNDPVVKIGQTGFLMLICIGAIISSSSIIALSHEVDVDEDTSAATMACRALPFLYLLGWALQYSSLSAKSYRLYRITQASVQFRRVSVSSGSMYRIVGCVVTLDCIGLILWAVLAPLEVRTVFCNAFGNVARY